MTQRDADPHKNVTALKQITEILVAYDARVQALTKRIEDLELEVAKLRAWS